MTRIGSLFSGYRGLDMAVQAVIGGEVVWDCEYEPPTKGNPRPTQAAARLLAHHWPDTPNLGDITSVDWATVEPVDVLTGGFPCQDLSGAGKRAGLRPGTRSGLWEHMAYAVAQLRPRLVVIENVRGLLSARAHSDVEPCPWCLGDGSGEPLRALGVVLGDLARLGYDCRWHGLRAADVSFAGWGGLGDMGGASAGGAGKALQRQRDRDAADDRCATVADADREQLQGVRSLSRLGRRFDARSLLRLPPAPHSPCDGWDERRAESAGLVGGPDAALSSDAPTDATGSYSGQVGRRTTSPMDSPSTWLTRSEPGYEPAIRRWEHVLGRSAPAPTEPGRTGQRLSPRFVEWMMGLPEGHVTAVPGLSRNEQLKLLGNGVVPQQATATLRQLTSLRVAA